MWNCIPLFGIFCLSDFALTKMGWKGTYYIIHSLHNAAIVYLTFPDVTKTLTDFSHISHSLVNYQSLELCFALHAYHIVMYWNQLRKDDWLHHGLMIGIALPIGGLLPAGTLLGYSLFFTTGLPGMIDYAALFLTRNAWIHKDTEKRINTCLNVWIRSPGCISHAILTVLFVSTFQEPSVFFLFFAYIAGFLNYWNGQYFMQQIVYDAGARGIPLLL